MQSLYAALRSFRSNVLIQQYQIKYFKHIPFLSFFSYTHSHTKFISNLSKSYASFLSEKIMNFLNYEFLHITFSEIFRKKHLVRSCSSTFIRHRFWLYFLVLLFFIAL